MRACAVALPYGTARLGHSVTGDESVATNQVRLMNVGLRIRGADKKATLLLLRRAHFFLTSNKHLCKYRLDIGVSLLLFPECTQYASG